MISDRKIVEIAAERDRTNVNSKTRTVYVDDYEIKGVAGEIALAEFFAVPHVPRGDLKGGDGGVDLRLRFVTDNGDAEACAVDVKTAAIPKFLWVEKGKAKADVYVLARYHPPTKRAICVGWEWGSAVRRAPVTFYGKHHHEIPASELRSMDDLRWRFIGVVR